MNTSRNIEKEIESLTAASGSEDLCELKQALKDALDLLRIVDDERTSLWQMLDEIKASDTENYAELLMQEVKKKINISRMSVSRKVGLA